jgi:hypothetical protein
MPFRVTRRPVGDRNRSQAPVAGRSRSPRVARSHFVQPIVDRRGRRSRRDGAPTLRLARDPEGVDLLPTGLERERRGRLAAEAERQRGEAERDRELQARLAAEARIAELEAERRRR